ncbi:hypothetical protein LNO81_18745 [Klebsiella variicola subsp. variicola]|nr:hypothetical protein [Klebsiella variicola subsp. variicola]
MAASALVNLCMVTPALIRFHVGKNRINNFIGIKQGIRKIAFPTAVVRVVIPGNYFSIREHYHHRGITVIACIHLAKNDIKK